jgi:cell division protein FtsB
MCERAVMVIPGLLRSKNSLESAIGHLEAENTQLAAENTHLKASIKRKNYIIVAIALWILVPLLISMI